MTEVDEGGLRPQRAEFVRETTYGEVPDNPAWERYSDAPQSVSLTPDANTERQDALGQARAEGFFANAETHEADVVYHLQRWFVTVNFTDPELTTTGATTLGVASDTAGDTSIDVTIYNDDETTSETITTDGSDGTTFVTGSEPFSTIGRVTLSSAASGTITVSEDSGGSAGTAFGTVAVGDTDVDAVDPLDAAGDGILRTRDNAVRNTHSAVFREEHTSGDAGTANAGRRIYYVCKGGKIDSVEMPFTTDESLPIKATVDYRFQKIRGYAISQPSSSLASSGTVESTDAGDTSQTLTLEDEGAAVTEDVSLNGTTPVTITGAFEDLDAAELDAETAGNVLVKDGSGNTLLTIYGQDAYEHGEGDLGVPALGTGSHASEIGTSYEIFSGDTLQATTGSLGGSGARITSGAMTVSNNLANDAQTGTPQRVWFAEQQDIELAAEVDGPTANIETIRQQLQSQTFDVEWVADGGTITMQNGKNMDPGDVAKEVNAARDTMDSTYEFADIAFS